MATMPAGLPLTRRGLLGLGPRDPRRRLFAIPPAWPGLGCRSSEAASPSTRRTGTSTAGSARPGPRSALSQAVS